MTSQLRVPSQVVTATLTSLQAAGRRNAEGLVLWLGRRADGRIDIVEAFVPEYESDCDYFYISPESMKAILAHLRNTGTFLAAQVHSHPADAFHSLADDERAIVRHRGALSIVIPRFGSTTTVDTFLDDAAIFCLSRENLWMELNAQDTSAAVAVI